VGGKRGLYKEGKVGGNDFRPKKQIKEEGKSIRTGGKWVGRACIEKGKWVDDFWSKKRIKEEGKPY
jgi:hypothetical protein